MVLVAHGSRDARSAAVVRALADCVALRWPASVRAAFLDFDAPSVPGALRASVGVGVGTVPIVVPALLTLAYHGRVDLPEALSSVPRQTRLAAVLGPEEPSDAPDPLLVGALLRRLSELDLAADGLVLIAAGTSYAPARSTVEAVAAALSGVLHVPCVVGYASASKPSVAQAVAAARALGATRVAVASYFVAPGRLYDAASASARSAGALGVAAPLGAAEELVRLILARAAGAAGVIQDR